jgi:hypothetical protein
MTKNTHDPEGKGDKPLNHAHPRRPYWKHAHRDWRVWIAVALMLASMLVYLLSDNLSLRPGSRTSQPMPEANLP